MLPKTARGLTKYQRRYLPTYENPAERNKMHSPGFFFMDDFILKLIKTKIQNWEFAAESSLVDEKTRIKRRRKLQLVRQMLTEHEKQQRIAGGGK